MFLVTTSVSGSNTIIELRGTVYNDFADAGNHGTTLPTIKASSASEVAGANDYNVESNLGCTYTFLVETLFSAGKIKTDGTDKFIGFARSLMTTAATGKDWFPGAANDELNFDGTTTGGIVGTLVRITAVASAQYFVEAYIKASGSQATPFAGS